MDSFTLVISVLKIITMASVLFVWVIRYDNIVEEFQKYGYSSKLRDFVGILKITSVLLIQSSNPDLVKIGSLLLAALMLAAFATHLKVKNPIIEFLPSFSLMSFSILFYLKAL